jgi:hypothetical protein
LLKGKLISLQKHLEPAKPGMQLNHPSKWACAEDTVHAQASPLGLRAYASIELPERPPEEAINGCHERAHAAAHVAMDQRRAAPAPGLESAEKRITLGRSIRPPVRRCVLRHFGTPRVSCPNPGTVPLSFFSPILSFSLPRVKVKECLS